MWQNLNESNKHVHKPWTGSVAPEPFHEKIQTSCAPERLMLHAPPSKMEYKENRELHQVPDYLANITTRRHLTLTTALTIQ